VAQAIQQQTLSAYDQVVFPGRLLFFVVASVCCGFHLAAASNQPPILKLPIVNAQDIVFRHLTIADGLSHSIVKEIVQDDQGFLWFATHAGLNRYDGYRFKVYKQDPRNPDGLRGVFIRALFKDRSGKLWIGVDQFLDRFDPATEHFTHYETGSTVVHISQDRAGTFWVATSNGLIRFDPSTGRMASYTHKDGDSESLSSSDVCSSIEDSAGTLWVATTQGIDAFDRRTGKATAHIPIDTQPADVILHEDRFGVMWVIYPNGSGLSVLDRKTNTLTSYQLYENEPSHKVIAGIASILEDRDGAIWLGTHGNGLLKLGPERGAFVRYRNNQQDASSLAEGTQLSLFEDRDGMIWAGVLGSGVDVFARKPLPFERIRYERGNPNSLDRTHVNAIYEDNHGIVWIGTEGGINRIDRKSGRYTFDRGQANVDTVVGDGERYLWTGAYGSGLRRLDTVTGNSKTYLHNSSDPHSLSNDVVVRLFFDHTGTLWAGTGDGLNRFDPRTESFTTYRLDPGNPASQSYVCIAEDQQGYLWLGTQNSGLQRFDPATGKFDVYQHDPAVSNSLSNNRVLSIHSDRSGVLWVGTQNGLDRFDRRTRSFTSLYERDGLPDASINAILENHKGDLWLSTNRGLSKFDPAAKTFTNYSAVDGLSGDEFHLFGASFYGRGGEMFFGGPNGITAFYPDRIVENLSSPTVVLTDFRLFAKPVSIGGGSPLQRSISYTSFINLSYWQNIFSLEFSALNYRDPATNRYRYRLEELDSGWNEVKGSNRSVAYTTLPPGRYHFVVQAATSRGPWNLAGVTLQIEVSPPWWSTWWFRSIIVCVLLVSIWELYRLRLQQISSQFQVRLEERVMERTRIARDLHDSLLQSFHGLMLRFQTVKLLLPDRPKEAKQVLETAIQQAAQAITESRDAVQSLRTLTSGKNDLIESLTALGEELGALYSNPEGAGRFPEFRLLVEGVPEPLHPVLQDEVYRITRESVGNAFRHAHASHIEVDVRFEGRLLRLRVRDDGIGMDSDLARYGREGHWGIPGMRERAKNIGGRLEMWSEPGAGTEIEITIPAAVAYRRESSLENDSGYTSGRDDRSRV
jgi:signal transduction histidine kinase/ligand-binding sensor domain-containing protein